MTDQPTADTRTPAELIAIADQFIKNRDALDIEPAAPGSIIGLWLATAAALSVYAREDADLDAQTAEMDRALDGYLTSALSIHDVMKAVPHPYNAVAEMTSKWAHDFVGFAQQQQRERAALLARVRTVEAERDAARANALEEAALIALGPTDELVDASTCRTIANLIRSARLPEEGK